MFHFNARLLIIEQENTINKYYLCKNRYFETPFFNITFFKILYFTGHIENINELSYLLLMQLSLRKFTSFWATYKYKSVCRWIIC